MSQGHQIFRTTSRFLFSCHRFLIFFLFSISIFCLFLSLSSILNFFSFTGFSTIFQHNLEVFHLTRVYLERVIPPRARPLAIPPPNFLLGEPEPLLPKLLFPPLAPPPRFVDLFDLMISSKLISILSSIFVVLFMLLRLIETIIHDIYLRS